MILNEKTFEKFGYYPKDLSYGSKNKIIMACDYCSLEFEKINRDIKKSNEIVNKDCCKKCKNKKSEDVNMIKYGVKNQFQRQEIQDKFMPETIDRLKTQEFKDLRAKTCIKKYGTANTSSVPEIQEKMKKTNLERYGVEYVLQNEDIKARVLDTMIERYGANYLATPKGRAHAEEMMLEKYGKKNAFELDWVKEKIKISCLKKYGETHHLKVPDRAIAHANLVLESKKAAGTLKTYKGKTISELRKDSGYSDSRFRALIRDFGYDEACRMTPKISSLEQITARWLSDMGLEFNKKKLGRCYPDFNIEDKKLIIEVGGLVWHSDKYQPDDNYHVGKLDYYAGLNYKSLFFWEDEVVKKSEIVKSIIRNKTGLITEKIAARKCTTEIVSTKAGREFVEKNHLMGPGPSSETYFLIYDGEPVSCLQMKKKNNLDYEVSRFCSKINVSVIGAFSKLLSHFEKNIEHTSIMTFIDKRYGEGLYLADMGFTMESCNKSFSWTDRTARYNRMRFPGNTGYELGYNKLWDCGQAKFVKRPT